ncbi:hypothetical protein [Sulfuriflexus sp.]|uniref:hypothetical protein n=1 Tax=Sulfuriflexus sp. TaxID=2015443 RepID=UPI0028CE8F4E|nr:hypothetical protein [Sulfuriflexus sp.]MDT8403192.1 hypothetical protein [Sulfuriflexus sp.]
MNLTLRSMTTPKKAFSWLLMLAFLSLVLFPYHYHLHHTDTMNDAGMPATTHVLDTHFYSGANALDEHPDDHDERHTIEHSSDITIKSYKLQFPVLALLLFISLLITLDTRNKRLPRPTPGKTRPPLIPFSTPLLRAPPQS